MTFYTPTEIKRSRPLMPAAGTAWRRSATISD